MTQSDGLTARTRRGGGGGGGRRRRRRKRSKRKDEDRDTGRKTDSALSDGLLIAYYATEMVAPTSKMQI